MIPELYELELQLSHNIRPTIFKVAVCISDKLPSRYNMTSTETHPPIALTFLMYSTSSSPEQERPSDAQLPPIPLDDTPRGARICACARFHLPRNLSRGILPEHALLLTADEVLLLYEYALR